MMIVEIRVLKFDELMTSNEIYSIGIFLSILDEFENIGQSISGVGKTGPDYSNPSDAIRSVILTFYSQNKDANMTDIQTFTNK